MTMAASRAPRSTGRPCSFGNGALAHLLRNRVYRGEINHKAQSHPGEHEPIIERALFEAVRARLDEQRRGKRRSRTSSEALLLGRIFDDRGHRMTPSYAVKNGARYRYYVSCVLAQGRKRAARARARDRRHRPQGPPAGGRERRKRPERARARPRAPGQSRGPDGKARDLA